MNTFSNILKKVTKNDSVRCCFQLSAPLTKLTNKYDNWKIRNHAVTTLFLRESHTDIKIPNFDEYRRSSLKKATAKTSDSSDQRRCATYLMSAALGTGFAYGTKAHVLHYIKFMDISADVFALAKIEISLADIPVGVCAIFKWRGKPLYVWHRPPDVIKKEQAQDLNILRDPEHDNDRCKKPEWLIVLAVCTHLGCVPNPNSGDYGGFYCPCHGAHYDGSGRTRKGPAPTNLLVPPHDFSSDDTLVVG